MNIDVIKRRVLASTKQVFNPLLDDFPNAAAAYSLRLLRTAYTGNCIQVRRSSDNALQNIGFVNGVLDTASLLSFVGAGDGFVRTWYDQSGNSRNATNINTPAQQPLLVNNGNLIIQNAKPSIFFNNARLNHSVINQSPSILSIIAIFRHTINTGAGIVWGHRSEVTRLIQLTAQTSTETRLQIRSNLTSIEQLISNDNANLKLAFSVFDNVTNSHILKINNNIKTINNTFFDGNLNSSLNTIGTTTPFVSPVLGEISEIIIYEINQQNNKNEIINNINAYYNIF